MIVVVLKTKNVGGSLNSTPRGAGGEDGGSKAILLIAYAAGLIGSVFVIPIYTVNVAAGRLMITDRLCKVFGFLNVLMYNALLVTSAAIAVKQCLLLVTKTHGRYLTTKTRLIVFVTWFIPIVISASASPYVGFNAHLLNCLLTSDVTRLMVTDGRHGRSRARRCNDDTRLLRSHLSRDEDRHDVIWRLSRASHLRDVISDVDDQQVSASDVEESVAGRKTIGQLGDIRDVLAPSVVAVRR